MMSNTTATSSIPGRSQRILINKKQPFSASAAASRCFKRGKTNENKGKASLNGSSMLDRESSFSSFATTQSSQGQQFGVKQRRFDAKIELKEYFNREPGPGAYMNFTPIEE